MRRALPGVVRLAGVDFTCAPSRRKPITVATGRSDGDTLHVEEVAALPTLGAFDDWLRLPGPWLGAFDFPFGLPREFVDSQGLGATCDEVAAAVHARCSDRMAWRAFIDAWGQGRAPGTRLLHRRTDAATGVVSTSPLQTRYVPVGLMYFEGVRRLIAADATLPGLRQGDPDRVALEAYPRRLAHALLGRRSYKNTDGPERRDARGEMLAALEGGRSATGLAVRLDGATRQAILADPLGDRLDAVLCLVQAAVAQRIEGYGIPGDADPVEGWIAG